MKKLIFFLLISTLVYSQEIVKDSATATGRFTTFKMGNHRLTINSDNPIDSFKLVEGIYTTNGYPYFGVKFFPYKDQSETILRDLYNSKDFKNQFPDAKISFEGIYNIKYTDTANSKRTFVRVYALNGGLMYLFFKAKSESDVENFLKTLKIDQEFYTLNPVLHN